MSCFQVFHRFAPKCRKVYAEISRCQICHWATRETLVKSLFFKENVLISVSLGSWKICYFQQRINKLFSEQKQMANCTRFAQKVWKCDTSRDYENVFFLIVVVVVDVVVDVVVAVVNVVSVVNWCWWFGVGVFGGAAADGDEERERTGKQEQQKETREQKRKAGPYTLPNSRSPASGGNYHVRFPRNTGQF